MITTRAMPAPSSAHHRRVANHPDHPRDDFADPLLPGLIPQVAERWTARVALFGCWLPRASLGLSPAAARCEVLRHDSVSVSRADTYNCQSLGPW